MTALCDLGWTVAKYEADEEAGPDADSLTFLQPSDDTTPAISLMLVGREAILRLRDFIDESLAEPDLPSEGSQTD